MRKLDTLRLVSSTEPPFAAYLIHEDDLDDFEDHTISEVNGLNLTTKLLADFLDQELAADYNSDASNESMYDRLRTALLATVGEHQGLQVLVAIYEAGGLIKCEEE